MEYKVGQKVRIKSNEWYEACKCLGLKVSEDKDTLGVYHIGQIGNIESICGDLVSVKFYDGDSDLFHKGWLEPISDGWLSTDEDHKLYIPSDEELKKSVTVNVPSDMEVSTKECGGKITINVHHKEEKVEEPKFKNGDILLLTNNDGFEYIAIFKEMDNAIIYVYTSINIVNNRIGENNGFFRDKMSNVRKADHDEQEKMFKELANQKQLRWNARELKFEPISWRVERGDRYWHITELGTVIYSSDHYSPYDNILYQLRNYFQTEELARKALPLYKDFFKNLNVI